MDRKRMIAVLVLAALVGALTAIFAPESLLLPFLLVPFVACIVLGWWLAIQNRAINRGWVSLFFPINPIVSVARSRSLIAFGISAAVALGGCVALLVKVSNA